MEGGSSNSGSSESGSLGISINISNLSRVPNRLGVSIDLSNLTCPIPPPSTTTASASIPLRGGPFVEPVGPTTPLPPTATAMDFFWAEF